MREVDSTLIPATPGTAGIEVDSFSGIIDICSVRRLCPVCPLSKSGESLKRLSPSCYLRTRIKYDILGMNKLHIYMLLSEKSLSDVKAVAADSWNIRTQNA